MKTKTYKQQTHGDLDTFGVPVVDQNIQKEADPVESAINEGWENVAGTLTILTKNEEMVKLKDTLKEINQETWMNLNGIIQFSGQNPRFRLPPNMPMDQHFKFNDQKILAYPMIKADLSVETIISIPNLTKDLDALYELIKINIEQKTASNYGDFSKNTWVPVKEHIKNSASLSTVLDDDFLNDLINNDNSLGANDNDLLIFHNLQEVFDLLKKINSKI